MGNTFSGSLGTAILTDSPLLGLADYAFGDEPNNPADIDRNTTVNKEALTGTQGAQLTQGSQETGGMTTALSGQTNLTDQTTQNTGLQTQTGQTGVGAFSGQTGLGASGYDPATGQFTSNLNQGFANNSNQALQASNQAYGALNNFNFNDTMGQRYNALEALQEQDRLQAQRAMEDRLYSQGRLGSTGGALQQNALMDAIMQQQAGNANSAFGQAQSQQQLYGNQAQQFGQAALQPQQMSLQQLQAIGALAPQVSSNTIGTNNFSNTVGLQDSTGFQDTTNNQVTNSNQLTESEQLQLAQMQAKEKIRTL